MKARVEGHKNLYRDGDNFAILNTDKKKLEAHQRKIQELNREKARENELNNIKNDIEEIKSMLRNLLKR